MFVDAVLVNLLVFVVGQAFAWGYLRSGRFWIGTAATTLLWVSLDWWLVARYLFSVGADGQYLPLLLLQATALVTTGLFVWARIRRRLGAALREQRFQKGVQQMLAGDFAPAHETFKQLVWTDAWDAAAWIALGDVQRWQGEISRARGSYRRARGVDISKQFDDLLRHRDGLLVAAPAPAPKKSDVRPSAEPARDKRPSTAATVPSAK